MKRIFSITGILVFATFLLTSFSLRENPQDPPRGKKVEKHIKMIKVDDEGNKMELDTILTDNGVFVWNGDTIAGNMDLKWLAKDLKMDSLNKILNYDIIITDDDNSHFFVMSPGGKNISKTWQVKTDGDSAKKYTIKIVTDNENQEGNVMMWHSDNGEDSRIVLPKMQGVPAPPAASHMMFFGKENEGNVIDLSDSGIISFKKKKMSGGREKITIIRNEPQDKNMKKVKEIVVTGKNGDEILIGSKPQTQKMIVNGNEEGIFNFIGEDGKKIIIKESKKGDEKKVEVEIEVEESEENK